MLHKMHRLSAIVIACFVFFHLINHLQAVISIKDHIQFMEAFREIYYSPIFENLLMLCVLFQIGSGLYFVKRRWGQRSGFFEKLQAASGAYLAFFLLIHVTAVSYGRYVLTLDTNFYFAAAGLNIHPISAFFYPYYFLAVVAIFSHIACAIHWLSRDSLSLESRNLIGFCFITTGILIGGLIVLSFGGLFYDIEIPANYLNTYQ